MSVDDAVKRVRSVIESLDRDGDRSVFPENPYFPTFRSASIPTAEGVSLREWVVGEGAKTAVEIGLAYGFSALYIGEGLLGNAGEKAKHTIIDAFQTQTDRYNNVGLNTLARAGLSKIIEFQGDKSHIALPSLLRNGRTFDFGFIDGCHLFDYVFLDLFYLGLLIKSAGIVFLDDNELPAVRKAASFYVANLGWRIEEKGSHKEREWLVLRTPAKQDVRHFTYFVDF